MSERQSCRITAEHRPGLDKPLTPLRDRVNHPIPTHSPLEVAECGIKPEKPRRKSVARQMPRVDRSLREHAKGARELATG
jgi:hypothetical protein